MSASSPASATRKKGHYVVTSFAAISATISVVMGDDVDFSRKAFQFKMKLAIYNVRSFGFCHQNEA
jgi:hypothetical protein